jgi:enamine deaminase RidA (YjgF/YER057c/UK114 family)
LACTPRAEGFREGAVSNIRYLNPRTLFAPPGYSHVVEVTGPGRTVYIAGQIGIDRSFKIVGAPGDARAQIIQAFENLKSALAEVGATFRDVVKINNYLVDIANLKEFREIRDTYLNMAAPPVSTLIVVSKLAVDGLLFEIDAVAVLP